MRSHKDIPWHVQALVEYMFKSSGPDGFIEVDDGGDAPEKMQSAAKALDRISFVGCAELGWFYRTKAGAQHEWCRIILPPGVDAWEAVADYTIHGRIEAWLAGYDALADWLENAPNGWRGFISHGF